MMTTIELSTCNHLGDTVCLLAAMLNAADVLPDVNFVYKGNYPAVFYFSPLKPNYIGHVDRKISVQYRDHGVKDNTAPTGNLVEGLTASLFRHLDIQYSCKHRKPVLYLTDGEIDDLSHFKRCVVLNSNCQQHSSVKGYPWWREVTALMSSTQFVLIGGDPRDVRDDSCFGSNVVDLRGQTSIRGLFALVANASAVLTPPSAVCHIAAALDKPCVTITGAREPTKLTDYPTTLHMTSVCQGRRRYDRHFGCMHFVTSDSRSCEKTSLINGRPYADCMTCIPPENVVTMLHQAMLDSELF